MPDTRKIRRTNERAQAKARRDIWPGGFVNVPAGNGLKDGDKYTIEGLRRNSDGTYNTHCPAGDETVFIARVAD